MGDIKISNDALHLECCRNFCNSSTLFGIWSWHPFPYRRSSLPYHTSVWSPPPLFSSGTSCSRPHSTRCTPLHRATQRIHRAEHKTFQDSILNVMPLISPTAMRDTLLMTMMKALRKRHVKGILGCVDSRREISDTSVTGSSANCPVSLQT